MGLELQRDVAPDIVVNGLQQGILLNPVRPDVVRETYHYVPYFVNVPVVHHIYSGPFFDYDYDWYYYPRAAYVERYPMSTPDDAATTEAPVGPGAPTQGPLYMNYCESAKAYYPKVTSCPEGWKFLPAQPPR